VSFILNVTNEPCVITLSIVVPSEFFFQFFPGNAFPHRAQDQSRDRAEAYPRAGGASPRGPAFRRGVQAVYGNPASAPGQCLRRHVGESPDGHQQRRQSSQGVGSGNVFWSTCCFVYCRFVKHSANVAFLLYSGLYGG
jgi:hypothetical protein